MARVSGISLEEEFKKNPELKKSDLKSLSDWCKKQPHLPIITDNELALFLHSNYYRIEPTKTTIDTYYTVRTHFSEFFTNRDPLGSKELRQAFYVTTMIPLEQRTKEGYRIILAKFLDYDPSKFSVALLMKYFFMHVDLWLYLAGTTPGHIILFDVQKVSMGHVARVNPVVLKKFLYYLQEGLPVRLKGLHYFNTTPAMDVIFGMMKPFLKKELMEMLHLHPNIESLSKYAPIEVLPNEMGGKGGPLMELHEAQIKKLEQNRDWFLQEESRARVDESKRPGKSKVAKDIGVEGSFKKLDID